MSKVKPLSFEIPSVRRIVLSEGDQMYVWDRDITDQNVLRLEEEESNLKNARLFQKETIDISGCAGESLFVFYVADCFDPPLFLVQAENVSDAHEKFITEMEHLVCIEPDLFSVYAKEDCADKTEAGYLASALESGNLVLNDNGTPCDTESVSVKLLCLVRVEP